MDYNYGYGYFVPKSWENMRTESGQLFCYNFPRVLMVPMYWYHHIGNSFMNDNEYIYIITNVRNITNAIANIRYHEYYDEPSRIPQISSRFFSLQRIPRIFRASAITNIMILSQTLARTLVLELSAVNIIAFVYVQDAFVNNVRS